jgi:hypothetical protein
VHILNALVQVHLKNLAKLILIQLALRLVQIVYHYSIIDLHVNVNGLNQFFPKLRRMSRLTCFHLFNEQQHAIVKTACQALVHPGVPNSCSCFMSPKGTLLATTRGSNLAHRSSKLKKKQKKLIPKHARRPHLHLAPQILEMRPKIHSSCRSFRAPIRQ